MFCPDWTGLNPADPRDRALAFRQKWPAPDQRSAMPIDTLREGDVVWRAKYDHIEKGVVSGLRQVRLVGGSVSESDKGEYVEFVAQFGYDYVRQTYPWKFFDSREKALADLQRQIEARIRDAERDLDRTKNLLARAQSGAVELWGFVGTKRVVQSAGDLIEDEAA